jgi:hypothetical protein
MSTARGCFRKAPPATVLPLRRRPRPGGLLMRLALCESLIGGGTLARGRVHSTILREGERSETERIPPLKAT